MYLLGDTPLFTRYLRYDKGAVCQSGCWVIQIEVPSSLKEYFDEADYYEAGYDIISGGEKISLQPSMLFLLETIFPFPQRISLSFEPLWRMLKILQMNSL